MPSYDLHPFKYQLEKPAGRNDYREIDGMVRPRTRPGVD